MTASVPDTASPTQVASEQVIALLSAAAPAQTHSSPSGVLYLLALAALVFAGWRISLRLHPFTHCKACGGDPRSYGRVFTRSFGLCAACGGTGRQLRRGAKPPTR